MTEVLVSHALCPYVQRATIVLLEKGVAFERRDVDLANKPDWFVKLSPTGKVPLLLVGDAVLFESIPICEYLDETRGEPLHPRDPLEKARHRAWMDVATALLSTSWGLYTSPDPAVVEAKRQEAAAKMHTLETALRAGPFFAGERFTLLDAVFAPSFRYFDVFEARGLAPTAADLPKVARWRAALAARPSVAQAVAADWGDQVVAWAAGRGAALARMLGPR
jgi:glutathione S-transferase